MQVCCQSRRCGKTSSCCRVLREREGGGVWERFIVGRGRNRRRASPMKINNYTRGASSIRWPGWTTTAPRSSPARHRPPPRPGPARPHVSTCPATGESDAARTDWLAIVRGRCHTHDHASQIPTLLMSVAVQFAAVKSLFHRTRLERCFIFIVIFSSFYLPNNTTVCTSASIQFRRAG